MRFFSHAAGGAFRGGRCGLSSSGCARRRGGAEQGVPPQPAAPVRHHLLPGPSRHRAPCGYAGSFQHRHHPHLPDGQRDGAAAAAGSLGACFVGNRISILLIGRRPIFKKHPKSREFFWIKSVFLAARCKKPGPQKPKTLWVFLPCQSLQ